MIEICLKKTEREIKKLPFCGASPSGDEIRVTNKYISINGKPIFPVMGEFHYARYRAEDWERELAKMKAGGVDIVATYVFWIHHEEEKGIWDFSGRRDLRRFVELCEKCGLSVLLRIGPWCHGECRNGGSPDWIALQRDFPIRTDNETYLFYVRRWFVRIEEQIHGLLFKDGGPIIGVQIENEYRAYAEKDHDTRKRYMHKVKKIAVECGFAVPLYTATAWGTATLNEMETLPVLGGYADAAWDKSIDELPENAHFLFQPPMNDESIGSDLKKDDGDYDFDIDINAYPYMTAELGGGMQMTRRRRVVIDAKDTEALCVCMMGSGSALLGYYMYHGGTNPMGKLSTMEECDPKKSESNVLPICSYDFQAIIRENGDIHESYDLTRRHHIFLKAFPWLANTDTVIPEGSASVPSDLETLRYAVRYDTENGSGFVFLNNHCRKRVLAEHKDISFSISFNGKNIKTPKITLKNDDIKYLPFMLNLGDAILASSNATPLCNIGKRWFFYTDDEPQYNFECGSADIITLSEYESRHAYLFGSSLWIADCALYELGGEVYAEFYKDTEITVYKEIGEPQKLKLKYEPTSSFADVTEIKDGLWKIKINYGEDIGDTLLELEYRGDRTELFLSENDKIPVADWFSCGLPLKISLNALNKPKELFMKIYPYQSDRYFDIPTKEGCSLDSAKIITRNIRCIK